MEENNLGLILAYILDGAGGGRKVGWEEINSWQPEQGVLWVHLNYSVPEVQKWLSGKSGFSCPDISQNNREPAPQAQLYQHMCKGLFVLF